MCGIAGILSRDREADLAAPVGSMAARLAHRGPDGQGVHIEPGVALAHRRLAIIDLSERAAQPMTNEDESIWLTFNGEIYNHASLRAELERNGHRFRSQSDSEVLLHLYEACGGDTSRFLAPVRGMFAFAIWDRNRRRLVLGRDRLGIKPLYFANQPDHFAFASDVDALTAFESVSRSLDWTSVFEYFTYLSVPGPNTVYRAIKCVPPATIMTVEDGRVSEHTYWSVVDRTGEPIRDSDEATEALAAALDEAVRFHMIADVQVGAFLSGGIDSGLVSAYAAEDSEQSLATFSATFPGESEDEGPEARAAAERLGTAHVEFALAGAFLDDIDRVINRMDQPLALTSAISLFQLSKLARDRVKVVLTGDGGDELFGGYSRHRPYSVPNRLAWIPEAARPKVGSIGAAALSGVSARSAPLNRLSQAMQALTRTDASYYLPQITRMRPEIAVSLLPPDAVGSVDVCRYATRVEKQFAATSGRDRLTRMLCVDVQTTLVDEMLTKVDRMTMAWGLEARVPLLDHKVVELAMRMTETTKRSAEFGKLPLRRLAARRLGADASKRPKSGFNSPFGRWIRGDKRTRDRFDALWASSVEGGPLAADGLASLRRGFETGRADVTETNMLAAMIFGLWAGQRGISMQ